MRLDDFQVPGNDIKVSGNLRIDSEELGGQTSGTDESHKGFKPKKLRVSLQIPHKNVSDLNALIQKAEAVGDNGERQVYTIVDLTAEGFGIKQVTFVDNVDARSIDLLKAWNISFTLVEHLSNPEKLEQRKQASATDPQSADGGLIASEATVAETTTEVELTGFEKFLQKVDNSLA